MTKYNGQAAIANKTKNKKVGNVNTTHAAQATCPVECPWYNSGCYAESGPQGAFVTNPLNDNATGLTPLQIAEQEAQAILKLKRALPLRLHVVGDCSTDAAADIVSTAAAEYSQRGLKLASKALGKKARLLPVWTYTHAWRRVQRRSWHSVSVLASVESTAMAHEAMSKGYAVAMVVENHPIDGLPFMLDGLRMYPCPEQTQRRPGTKCDTCQLCWNADALLKAKTVITFATHGDKTAAMTSILQQISDAAVVVDL